MIFQNMPVQVLICPREEFENPPHSHSLLEGFLVFGKSKNIYLGDASMWIESLH